MNDFVIERDPDTDEKVERELTDAEQATKDAADAAEAGQTAARVVRVAKSTADARTLETVTGLTLAEIRDALELGDT